MSKCCCKYAKWFPHNWLCLKGLSYIFLGIFYIAFLYGIYQAIQVLLYPFPDAAMKWRVLFSFLLTFWGVALISLTVAKVLGALRKIKKAVAPCCQIIYKGSAQARPFFNKPYEKNRFPCYMYCLVYSSGKIRNAENERRHAD